MKSYNLEMTTRTYFGNNCLQEALKKEKTIIGSKTLLITTGGTLKKLGFVEKLISMLEAKVFCYDKVTANPDVAEIREAIEIGNEEAAKHNMPQISMASDVARSIMASQGTTRPEVVRLLTQLNVNLNLQLTKTDTANLLACLLTANENQLRAIYKNKKTPVAIKTVIKRLLDDAMLGNIETVEKLWDRIFGKAGMMLNLPEQTQQMTGIIPNTPVSREAYIVIRDTLLK